MLKTPGRFSNHLMIESLLTLSSEAHSCTVRNSFEIRGVVVFIQPSLRETAKFSQPIMHGSNCKGNTVDSVLSSLSLRHEAGY
jgi:hypothetical protein